MSRSKNKTHNNSIDIFRLLCAVMVVAIHTAPFSDISGPLGDLCTNLLPRIAVPYFFATAGYFYISALEHPLLADLLWKLGLSVSRFLSPGLRLCVLHQRQQLSLLVLPRTDDRRLSGFLFLSVPMPQTASAGVAPALRAGLFWNCI